MQKNLVIVESPAKAKTIGKFLGDDYKVMSSYGHIRDLKEKEFGIDIEHGYTPEYVVPEDKKKLVADLKKASKSAENVLLASDEDREGEAIAWHLYEELKLKPDNTKRIVFHEITKTAILNALEHPRDIDINLVDAQQARRVLDRIVGFEVSPILWRKVKPALSAGRVQSVAVRLIVEREREIHTFVYESAYRVIADFILPDGKTILKAELNKRFKAKKEALAFLEICKNSDFKIEDISKKPFKKSPAPPFTTSTLQQEAARKLNFSVSQTMRIAQGLYEEGHITYMRTDSVNLSNLALNTSKKTILETYGEKYYKFRQYQTKSKGAQEAHEAIRPTYMNVTEINGTAQEKKLYDLIYKRTIACQMADAELERTTITVNAGNNDEKFIATGEVVTFDGFLQVYMESFDDENENEQGNGLLPQVKRDEPLTLKNASATERFTQRPPRYTEASLVHRMEELGIGRPSTYAPTIQTIQNREYVVRGDKSGSERSYNLLSLKNGKITDEEKTEIFGADKNKLIPTDIGTVVNDFLIQYFPDILDYNFTASVEKDFDTIAEGKQDWRKSMNKFYKNFHPTVEAASAVKTEHKVGERSLGIDTKSGKPVFVKIGRYGPIAQLGEASEKRSKKDKPQFAPLMKNQSIETITLEEAVKLFELPRTIGTFEGEEITANVGRFGPYIRHNGTFVSIPKEMSPMTITLEESVKLIEDKRSKDSQKHIKSFEKDGIEILNGRFGPYIASGGKNYRIPKDTKPDSLSLEDCKKIIAEAADKPTKSRGRFAKKSASEEATTKTTKTKQAKK